MSNGFEGYVDDIDDAMERVRRMIAKYGERDPELLEGPAMGDLHRLERRITGAIGAVRDAEIDAVNRQKMAVRALENGGRISSEDGVRTVAGWGHRGPSILAR
jgi:hypothetical protein